MKNGILCLLIAVALVGAGCAKRPASQAPAEPQSASTPTSTAFPTFRPTEKALTPKQELAQALTRFTGLKSFRARVRMTSSQGEITGTLEFARPNRFRGSLKAGEAAANDIIVVERDLYMRLPPLPWLKLSDTEGGKKMADRMQSTMNGELSIDKLVVDENLVVEKSRDDTRGCDQYATMMKDAQRTDIPVTICIVDGLPKYADIKAKQGDAHVEYYDYNAMFLIERPM